MSSTRRDFIQQSLIAGSTIFISGQPAAANGNDQPGHTEIAAQQNKVLDLSPAKWIWLPAGRTLPNTILLFARRITLKDRPLKARGYILGESRYKLYANGKRVQFGPAPADPRWPEADPFDITGLLLPGENTIGAEVLFYGFGDGTWPIGKPGFIFSMEIEYADGTKDRIVSDDNWHVKIAQSWRPGQYKRWYLRAFQEEFDARLYPRGWNEPAYDHTAWLKAMVLAGAADKPASATNSTDYLHDSSASSADTQLRQRSIKLIREHKLNANKLSEEYRLKWKIAPEEYFQFVLPEPDCFEIIKGKLVEQKENAYHFSSTTDQSTVLTFEFAEQHVGFPFFSINAPEGTIIELLVHEAHEPGSCGLMNSHFNSWSRFICSEGDNHFETFDYESFRWVQLHIRNAKGNIIISDVGIRRRIYDFTHEPFVETGDARLQPLLKASVNTLYNCCQETIVDGMARERQQYSGDVGHVLHALLYGTGTTEMALRYLNTYSQGLTLEGFFLDCWPAYDRLARIPQREMGMSSWGPILDHGIGFNFDCYHYYLYTGNHKALEEIFPRLVRFYKYLLSITGKDDLLPVENIGLPCVWIDHDAYLKQRHKQCAFNLYASAMLANAFAPLCRAFGENDLASAALSFSKKLLAGTVKKYWSSTERCFINNLPWLAEEKQARICDRSVATAILFNQAPAATDQMVKILLGKPASLGISYPANAGWRYWALASEGHVAAVLDEFREKWYTIPSVTLNNTLAETWEIRPDSSSEWSHCPLAPLYFMYMNVAGIRPLNPGYDQVMISPALEGINELALDYHTIKGPIKLQLKKAQGRLSGTIDIPEGIKADFVFAGKTRTLTKGNNKINT